jgi:hypothetical protein
MALPISNNTRTAAEKTIKEPNIVLCIEGYDICIPSVSTYTVIKVGAPGLIIGGSWIIGGVELMGDADSAISMLSLIHI